MTTLALAESRARQFLALTKPRVVSLIVFMRGDRHVPGDAGHGAAAGSLVAGTLGIALVAGAAAAINCLVEQKIDALMPRTQLASAAARRADGARRRWCSPACVGGAGLWLLLHFVNALTMWLTLATFVGYAVVYTVLLKPATPQNIVIGGASGAMPPVLGWAAVTGDVPPRR